MTVDRSWFQERLKRRSPEGIRVFDALDTDFDQRVDAFELLVILIFWSCTLWEEKMDMLFRCFDFNSKGALRPPELAFLVSTAARATTRFVQLEEALESPTVLKDAASEAFGGQASGGRGAAAELRLEAFQSWFQTAELPKRLQAFVEEQAAAALPEALEAPTQREVRLRRYRAQDLAAQLEKCKVGLAAVDAEALQREEGSQQRFDILRRSMDEAISKIAVACETLESELMELQGSLEQVVETGGGPEALLEPAAKHRHDRLLAEIAVLERRCQEDCRDASEVLEGLTELTFGTATARRAVETAQRPVSPEMEPVLRMPTEADDRARERRVVDRQVRAKRAIQKVDDPKAAPGTPGAEEGSQAGELEPVVIAFADFDPPPSQDTQMLALRTGDEIVATGRDGGGWWYGRNVKTFEEGWFPPTFVRMKDEV